MSVAAPAIKYKPAIGYKIGYLPELDSLRTLAVTMTLLAHFSPIEIPYMWYGVPIFFTISGFLITTILITSFKANPDTPRWIIIKNFMIRRVLRLFPTYYLVITFFWLARKFNLYLWKDEFTPYFFTYTPNFLIHRIGSENALCFSHLWSLGVEEQFYLFWPWLLLLPLTKYRIPIILSMIAGALVFTFFDFADPYIGALTVTNFHTLGIGALLACFYVNSGRIIEWLKKYRQPLFVFTFIHLITVLIFFKDSSPYWHLYREIALCICTFSIVLVSIFGWNGLAGYLARNKQIQYLGTISYGIYLFHLPLMAVIKVVLSKLPEKVQPGPWLLMVIGFGFTIALAAFSYKYIEMRFLRLKRYFA